MWSVPNYSAIISDGSISMVPIPHHHHPSTFFGVAVCTPSTTGARPSFDGFSRWSRCEPRNVVALRYHLVTTRPPPGGGGWLHSEGEWGRSAGHIVGAMGGIDGVHCTPSIPPIAPTILPAVLQRSHHPPTPPSTRNTNRRFFLASRPPP